MALSSEGSDGADRSQDRPLAQLPRLCACKNYFEWIVDSKLGLALAKSFVSEHVVSGLISDVGEVACSEDQPSC